MSAEAAECADDQGKYWEMHDKMFAEQDKLGSGTVQYGATELKKWAREIGLDGKDFDTCLDSRKHQAEVEKDTSDGSAAGVSGTPSFFINGQLLVGAQPFSEFQKVIDAELK
jgi:protein-disulfide isomerase